MKLWYLLVVLSFLWIQNTEGKSSVTEGKNYTKKKAEKRVRKQHVPGSSLPKTRKQYIDGGASLALGGGSLGDAASLGDGGESLGVPVGSLRGGGGSLGDGGGSFGDAASLGDGGESLGNQGLVAPEAQPNYVDDAGNSISPQQNIANTLKGAGLSLDSGLSQDGNSMLSAGDNGVDSMSNDQVEGSESTGGRQMIGNGKEASDRMHTSRG